MASKKRITLTQSGWFLIIIIMILVLTGMNSVFQNVENSNDRQILDQVNETSADTNRLAEDIAQVFFSQNRTNLIVDEIREVQRTIESERQNQTDRLLPIFFESFNQTEMILNETHQVLERLNSGVDRQDEIVGLLENISMKLES